VPAGLVVVADVQTAGRGRLGRTWESRPGSALLCSILLRPPVPADCSVSAPFLAVARVSLAGRAAASAVAGGRGGLVVGLKWPNDLVAGADGLGGKLAGVLAEVERDAVVVGIGMNLTWAPPGAACLGEGIHRDAVLDALLRSLDDWLVADDRMVLRAYREACVTLGRPVRVELGGIGDGGGEGGGESFTGTAADITDTGALLVETDVCIREVSAGDVIHLR